ncbi:Glu-tRNA(Gln) amidotransferase subunit GatE [Sulfurisphaera tokodaii]|uniref:Glutamyl-tRNA(Gln) amidotransferase subunit E n=2 Tax=Sulfurisphaera tokodaii TaxID=111955 RepID=GATE_SULTO|nr:Glu-tRNA(Gln) amidotransferase subunit GatE [Sulfurisphaera tokodaii]Q971W7.1 RecName: Full=Glutamyl-tRNA(Gln) amidotransferase subunit E; Short=Glu-ADT subunit E [Sulfurisphaera tokodaii str. 7]BAB66303.1 glutamyl-tRNA(Gln) amidotransferase subunit GatE [Sulfurisphaera tokodaii str. 7]HII73284.1 Glu-tRNA(Gln) amidotransferase subunit GatE [Sulfurisphaera tokodaii]
MTELDYSKIGLKVGLEIHQQLNTAHKLFCECPTTLHEEYHTQLERYLRPSFSELGEIDIAALFEWQKGKKYVYRVPPNSCLVECDEEPPHIIDEEALSIAVAVSLALHSTLVDEVYVMRKIVIDGSNTSGFQRTAIISLGGYIEDNGQRIGIQTIALEEDAARKITDSPTEIIYNLDRLGIPLIEISTAPDIKTPEQAERVALKIGQLLRLTGRVKRGIGTIRQDLNVSIQGGVKTEIKGVQLLELIPDIIKNEARRQYELLRIKEELQKRNLNKDIVKNSFKIVDLTEEFKDTNSKIIRKELEKNGRIYGLKIAGFKGIFGWQLMPNRRFGTEVADYVRALAGLGGLFHSDELPNYGITKEEVEKVRKILQINENDAFIIIVGPKEKLDIATNTILDRILYAFDGVPKETRAALDDGTTKFMRPQPGSARMYPETDIPPRRIDERILELSKQFVPEQPEIKLKKLIELGLSKDLANTMLNSLRLDLFEELVKKYSPKVSPTFIASTLEITVKYVKSKGGDISVITDNILEELIKYVYEDKISKDAVQEILLELATSKTQLNEIIKKYTPLNETELEKIIIETIEENKKEIENKKDKAFNIIMSKVMNKVRGRADSKKVIELIKKHLG